MSAPTAALLDSRTSSVNASRTMRTTNSTRVVVEELPVVEASAAVEEILVELDSEEVKIAQSNGAIQDKVRILDQEITLKVGAISRTDQRMP